MSSGGAVRGMQDELKAAITNAYNVFPEMDWRDGNATVCPCCVSEFVAHDLARTPREDLSAEFIREYLSSAHQIGEGSASAEFRHFLPRIFELLSMGETVSLHGNECALDRLRRGPVGSRCRDFWSKIEIDAIDRFFQVYWRSILARTPELFQQPHGGQWLFRLSTAEAALTMIAGAGGELAPLLAIWEADESESSALHMAALVGDTMIREWRPFALLEERSLGDPHWLLCQEAMGTVVDWLVDPRRRDRLFDACIAAAPGSPEAIALAEVHDEIDRILHAPRKG
jgi:hypothetical protein